MLSTALVGVRHKRVMKNRQSHTSRLVLHLGRRGTAPAEAISFSSLGLLVKDSQELKFITQIKSVMLCNLNP